MPYLPNVILSNVVQNNVNISSRQNILNFFGAPSFTNKPKLGLKVQLKVQNINLSITIIHINTESSWLKGCWQENMKNLRNRLKIFDLV